MSAFAIRAFDEARDEDWERWVAFFNQAVPDQQTTVAEMREMAARRPPSRKVARWFGEVNGQSVGVASYSQPPFEDYPNRFELRVRVHPEAEGHGFGRALYDTAFATLSPFDPTHLTTYVREDNPRGVRFAEERGFVEGMRSWESRLDVAAFDPAPWEAARQRAADQGIVIRSYAELADDLERDVKVWELGNETARDVPRTEPFTPLPYEDFRRLILDSPATIPEGLILAVEAATGRYVGVSNLGRRSADAELQTGLTAVRREWRGKGVALAMKLRAIDYAKSVNAPVIRTDNATTNQPMLAINVALGFVKRPAMITLVKTLKEEEETNGA